MRAEKAAPVVDPPAKFVHDFLFLRSAGPGGKAHGGFAWPTVAGGIVTAPDWDPAPVCGGGLHGLAEGVGDWGLLKAPSDPFALWYVCGAIRSEAVTVEDSKIKVPRCRVLRVGSFAGAMDMISPRMTDEVMRLTAARQGASGHRGSAANSGYSGSAANSGDSGSAANSGCSGSAANSGYRGSAANSGDSGSAANSGDSGSAASVGKHGVALSHGIDSVAMVEATNLLILVERDRETGAILHHFAAMCGEKGVKPGIWYTLTDGKLTMVKA